MKIMMDFQILFQIIFKFIKGLMSNPNKTLGEWILREILKIKENVLVTYEMLEEIGIDSIEVRKLDNENYEVDFKKLNSYYNFMNSLKSGIYNL